MGIKQAQCVIKAFSAYIDKLYRKSRHTAYINVGAGDLYFDRELFKRYKRNHVYAVGLAYKDMDSEDKRIHKYHYFGGNGSKVG